MKFLKYLPAIAAVLLGVLFIMSGVVVLLSLVEMPPPPEGRPAGHFMAALGPTGYINFVKVLEILGGVLVDIPKTRNLGLLVLGPIIVNILAFHPFIMLGEGLLSPPIILITVIPHYLLWTERERFGGLVR